MVQNEIENLESPMTQFDDLHAVVVQLSDSIKTLSGQVSSIRKHISKIEKPDPEWMTIQQLAGYLPNHPGISTIYRWVAANSIPHRKGDKGTIFLKSEIDEWLNYKAYVPDWWNERNKVII